jgi:hypothetical protein
MWLLLISLYNPQPLGHVQSKGLLQVPQSSYEVCQRERDRVRSTWYIDGYRLSARCVHVPHYSNYNGAYTQND